MAVKQLKKKTKIRRNVMLDQDKEEAMQRVLKDQGEGPNSKSELINKALGEYLAKQASTKFLSFLNQKGGVGKTTSVQNVATGMARRGRKVLVIDLDPQGNFTKGMGAYDPEAPSIYEVLKGEVHPGDAMVEVQGINVIPADLRLSQFEFLDIPGKDNLLKIRTKDFDFSKFDYVIFDCAPSFGKLNLNALSMTRSIYVPIQTEYYAMEGIAQLIQTVETGKMVYGNESLEIKGVFATMYDARRNLDKSVLSKIEEVFEGKLLKAKIRDNVKVAEAPIKRQNIFDYAANSNGAKDYKQLVDEIIEREEGAVSNEC